MNPLEEVTGQPLRNELRANPVLAHAAATSLCLIVIGVAVYLGLDVLGRLLPVLVPVLVATFLTRILIIPSEALRQRGWRPAPRAAVVLLGFLAFVAGLVALVAPPMVDEFSTLGPTLEDGIADIEDWLVEDSPFDVTRADIERFRAQVEERADEALRSSGDQAMEGARVVLEVLAGILLALILTFFAIKDGPRFQIWATDRLPEHRRGDARRMAAAGWAALGGYLRASMMLGIVEAIVIGLAMLFAGAELVLPVMALTFVAAFLPLVGATIAGVAAVLVTLATAGLTPALIVAGVAIAVQQLDNDLLAPWIYGKSLQLHPAVILLSIATGTALFGFIGTVLAVPVTAVAIAVVATRTEPDEGPVPPDEQIDAVTVDS